MYPIAMGVSFGAAGLWAPTVTSIVLPGSGAPVQVNFTGGHGLSAANRVALSGTTGVTGLNATWPVTVVSPTQITLDGSGALTGSPAGSPVVALAPLDISGITDPDPVVVLRFESLTAEKRAIVALEDTENAFSASIQRYNFAAKGEIQAGVGVDQSITVREFPLHRFGVASAAMQLRCLAIDAAANVKVSAWISAS